MPVACPERHLASTLAQRYYILPTGAGWILALTLLVLLLASIISSSTGLPARNFLLAGQAAPWAGMHICHGTLRGLTLRLQTPEPQFLAGAPRSPCNWSNQRRSRAAPSLYWPCTAAEHWAWADVPGQGSAVVQIAFFARAARPASPCPADSRNRATRWAPSASGRCGARQRRCWSPGPNRRAAPAARQAPQRRYWQRPSHGRTEFDGVRAYRRGDPMKLVVWKSRTGLCQRRRHIADCARRPAAPSTRTVAGPRPHGPGRPGDAPRASAWVLQADRLAGLTACACRARRLPWATAQPSAAAAWRHWPYAETQQKQPPAQCHQALIAMIFIVKRAVYEPAPNPGRPAARRPRHLVHAVRDRLR